MLFYAQSGAGKSSLINARLIPQLREIGYAVLPVARVGGELPPGVEEVDNVYLFNLMLSLAQSEATPGRFAHLTLSSFLAGLSTDDGEHYTYEEATIPSPTMTGDVTAPARPYVLIVDQFEELITSHPGRWQERVEFFRQLNQAMLDDPNLWVVLALREDYVAPIEPYAPLLADRMRARFYMERMGVDAALDAIRRPAGLGGRPFAAGAAEQLVENLRQVRVPGQEATIPGQYVEPVQLQVVCYQLWENIKERPPASITQADLEAIGDIDTALAQFYRDALAAVATQTGAKVSERQLRTWFDRELITEAGTRSIVYQGEKETAGIPNEVACLLQDCFLLRAELRAGSTWLELTHDRLVHPVREDNAAWFEEHMSTLQRQAALWDKERRPKGLLLREDPLAEAERWIMTHQAELEQHERDFLQACQEARALTEQREIALRQARIGRRALARQLAAEVRYEIKQDNPDFSLALLLAEEAVRVTWQKDGYVHPGVYGAVLDAYVKAPPWCMTLPRHGHRAAVASARFSPDGGRIVTASDMTRVWDAKTGKQLLQLGHTNFVFSACFSSDGARIVSAGSDGVARLWDATTGEELLQLIGHSDAVYSAVFDPACTRIITTSRDGTARIWNASSGQEVLRLTNRAGDFSTAAYSPDASRIVTGSQDGTAQVCDAITGRERVRLVGPGAWLHSVAFSPDGSRIVAASDDGTTHVWDTETGQIILQLTNHGDAAHSATYSPDGSRIVTAGGDGTAYVWDMETGRAILELTGHVGGVNFAAYCPDGSRIVTAGEDHTARVWDATTGRQLLHIAGRSGPASWAAFSTDGASIVTAGADRTACIWDARAGQVMLQLTGHWSKVYAAAYSPDGHRIVTASDDGTARIWNALTGQEELRLTSGAGALSAAAFSQDGTRVVTAGRDSTATIWDAETGQLLLELTGHSGAVVYATFSPDGTRIITASRDATARLWDAMTGTATAATVRPLGRSVVRRLQPGRYPYHHGWSR